MVQIYNLAKVRFTEFNSVRLNRSENNFRIGDDSDRSSPDDGLDIVSDCRFERIGDDPTKWERWQWARLENGQRKLSQPQ